MSYRAPLEVHQVTDEQDESSMDNCGLETADDRDVCEHCESRIGRGRGLFVPYVIVLDDTDEYWFVCGSCASPLTHPGDEE